MADGRTFAAIIVSSLGTPQAPFGWAEIVGLAILAAALAAYFLLEYGLGRLLARLFHLVRRR